MSGSEATRFAQLGAMVAAGGAAAGLVAARQIDPAAVPWAAVGWFPVAALGVSGGAWAIHCLGRRGASLLAALAGGTLARLAVVPAGAFFAAGAGGATAVWGWLAGALFGYLPVQLFELFWLARREPAVERRPGS